MMKQIFFILIILLLLAGFVSAEEGCYLNKESALYCMVLEKEEALNDCSIYNCFFEQVFFPGKNCEDARYFPQCQEIFCKITCDYTPAGICFGGEVPKGEENIWCSPGCCQFDYYQGSFCDFKENKWLCEVEAQNKNVNLFSFSLMSEQTCKDICNQALISGERITQDLVREEVLTTPQTLPSVPVAESGEETNLSWVGFILIAVAVIIILRLFYHKHSSKQTTVIKETKPRFFLRKRSDKKKLKKMEEERNEKIKLRNRNELFHLFESLDRKNLTHFDLLKKITEAHELKDRRRLREEQTLRKLEKFIKDLKKKEFTQKEAEDVFERLKKIVEKSK